VCGENVSAKHSVRYDGLESYFLMFSIWNEHNVCLSWDDSVEWANLLSLKYVPVLYRGVWNEEECKTLCGTINPETQEGLVIRPAASFAFKEFRNVVGKWVRKDHVQTDEHWTRKPVEWNGLS
jgi:hypothetical protein